jgi:DNA replication ATP-dependent helicase Dna2
MPGTGKTTTIAYIIQLLVERGKTILLTSYTHNAVDNLLFKLKDLGLDFLRLGRTQQMSPALKRYTLDWSNIKSPEALESTPIIPPTTNTPSSVTPRQENCSNDMSGNPSSHILQEEIRLLYSRRS